MRDFLQDIRYGLRILAKHSGFTAAAVLTLALGIGADTAIFSLVDGVLLKPLPFEEPDRLVAIWEADTQDGHLMSVAPLNFRDWREQNTTFEDIAAFYPDDFTLVGSGDPEQIEGARVSAGTFALLGIGPAIGRGFLPEEDRAGGPRAVVLGDSLWKRRFGSSREILGSAVRLDGADYTVIGVMPPGFSYPPAIVRQGTAPPIRAELWAPLEISPNQGRGAPTSCGRSVASKGESPSRRQKPTWRRSPQGSRNSTRIATSSGRCGSCPWSSRSRGRSDRLSCCCWPRSGSFRPGTPPI